jgi:hypothetical protein
MNNKDIISCIKGYFTLNDVAKLAPISKLWSTSLIYSPNIVMTNADDENIIKVIKHIGKSPIKNINISINRSLLFHENIDDFLTSMTKTGSEIKVMNFYNPNYYDSDMCYLYKYDPMTNIGLTYLIGPGHIAINNSSVVNGSLCLQPKKQPLCLRPKKEPIKDVENIKIVNVDKGKFYNTDCYYDNRKILSVNIHFCKQLNCVNNVYKFTDLIKRLILSKLEYLFIANNDNLTYKSFEYLHNINQTNLKYLNLKTCFRITGKTFEYITEGLKDSQIEYFDINYCTSISDDDIKQIISAIRETNLKYFILSINKYVYDISLDSTKMSKNLQYLNLTFCRELTGYSLKLLMEGLSETNIVSLDLSQTTMDYKMILHLVEELKNSNIRHLNLSGSSIFSNSLCALIGALKDNNISSFDLSGTCMFITEENMPKILKIINCNKNIISNTNLMHEL